MSLKALVRLRSGVRFSPVAYHYLFILPFFSRSMNTRGQMYILSALIIAFILYTILTPSNVVKRATETSNFYEIAENFDQESALFLDYLIESQQPVYDAFLNFTLLFTSYTKTKNQHVGLLYSFVKDDVLYLANYGEDTAVFTVETMPYVVEGCLKDVGTSLSIAGLDIAVDDVDLSSYRSCLVEVAVPKDFSSTLGITLLEGEEKVQFATDMARHPDLIIISREKSGETRRVYTKGTFIYLPSSP